MRAVLIGAVESTRVAARCLAAAPDWDLAALVTLPLELGGRHSDFLDLAQDADAAGCALLRFANANSEEAIAAITELRPDYLFVIGWSQLCGERLMAIAPGRTVGYHPAALPRLRGRGVIPWTILLGEPITAGSLFFIDAGTDSGPILAQHYFHVAADATAAELYAQHMEALGHMMPPLLAGFAAGTAVPRVQDTRHATWAARRRPEDGEIDWTGSAEAAWRLVRACGDPYPGARTTLGDELIIVAKAEPVPLLHHAAALPGQIVERDGASFVVRCGDGGLRVSEWRRTKPGLPPMHARLGGGLGGGL
ncbi:methionyl-tRNA formyltransferase [Flavisphingomonas formosensis]|uniref:methionyl-tRNA formyltransferase n=1 Tax=Flavisphingomonas formosensis TaxID=861534 RepID=UPI0012F84A04|nr:formyltransferase family protein [Sphingomonas formosensis]